MTLLLQDLLKLISWYITNFNQYESILKCFAELFSAAIALSRVLSGKYPEGWMSFYNFLSFNDMQLPVVV